MVDIHSHIIPNLDHGAKNTQETIELLKISESSGITDIFATPHYNVGEFNNTMDRVIEEVNNINEIAKNNNISIKVYPGQEIYLTRKAVKDFINGKCGTLNYSGYVLIELDYNNISIEEYELLFEFKLRSITPIIAHPERYSYIIDNPEVVNKFIKEGCLFQLNYGSLTGKFGKQVKRISEILLKYGVYSFIGSDAHDLEMRNTEIKKRYLKRDQIKLFSENGKKIIENKKIDYLGKQIRNKGII